MVYRGKASFIDSIINSYPVPLILLAESKDGEKTIFEIIDGMQRLNAITSFIENEFSVNGFYFDLEAMAETKLLKDEHVLEQKQPIMDRKICVDIALYVLPMSTYKGANEKEIDEVFRRINANGKHLSRQEIRQAGALSSFAEVVRQISSEIRGDVSLNNRVTLNNMKEISITSRDLAYGINVDEVFWVDSAVIRREQVRESKDEEIIADIVAVMLLDEIPSSSSSMLDEFYALKDTTKRANELDEKIKVRSAERIKQDFFIVFDTIKSLLNIAGTSFNALYDIENVEDNSLVLIDELEMALHPAAQIRLMQYLMEMASQKNLTILISTHSASIIKAQKSVILLEKETQGIKVYNSCPPAKAIGAIGMREDTMADIIDMYNQNRRKIHFLPFTQRYYYIKN